MNHQLFAIKTSEQFLLCVFHLETRFCSTFDKVRDTTTVIICFTMDYLFRFHLHYDKPLSNALTFPGSEDECRRADLSGKICQN